MPKRIQRKRVRGWRKPEGSKYVGRGSQWGNPFKVGEKLADECVPNGYIVISEADCLEFFENYVNDKLTDDPRWLEPLRDKDLACWCPLDGKCHADILLRLANPQPENKEVV